MRIKKKLTNTELSKFKKLLEKKKTDILLSFPEQEEVDIDGDEVDVIQGVILSDVSNALSKRELETVNKINIALEKIDRGTFGFCESCDELISVKRLEAVLGCSICISCAEQEEIDVKKFNN
jgi:DnaK suppressor protein